MNTKWKRAAIAAISTSLVLSSLAGCSKKEETFDNEAAVMTINDETVSAGLMNFVAHYMQAEYQYMYDMYFGENSFSYEMSTDYTIGDMVLDSVIDMVEEMVLVRQHMDEYDVSLSDEEEAAIAEAAEAFIEANDEEVLTVMSATREIVEEYLTLVTSEAKMEPVMTADVDTEVSDEEAAQRRVKYALITAETEDEEEEAAEEEEAESAGLAENDASMTQSAEETEEAAAESETAAEETEEAAESETAAEETQEADAETETAAESETAEEETEEEAETETEDPAWTAAMEEAYAKAEEVISLIEDGMDFDEALASVDEELTSYETTFGANSTSVSEALIIYTEGLDDDTLVTEPIETSTGYYVAYVVSALDREATEEEKESIVEERKEEALTELITVWGEEADVTTDLDVLATIVYDYNLEQVYEEEPESESDWYEDESDLEEFESET